MTAPVVGDEKKADDIVERFHRNTAFANEYGEADLNKLRAEIATALAQARHQGPTHVTIPAGVRVEVKNLEPGSIEFVPHKPSDEEIEAEAWKFVGEMPHKTDDDEAHCRTAGMAFVVGATWARDGKHGE